MKFRQGKPTFNDCTSFITGLRCCVGIHLRPSATAVHSCAAAETKTQSGRTGAMWPEWQLGSNLATLTFLRVPVCGDKLYVSRIKLGHDCCLTSGPIVAPIEAWRAQEAKTAGALPRDVKVFERGRRNSGLSRYFRRVSFPPRAPGTGHRHPACPPPTS